MYDVIRKGKFHNLSIECLLDLFDKVVKPILLYGSEIWGTMNFKKGDVLEKKFEKTETTNLCMKFYKYI